MKNSIFKGLSSLVLMGFALSLIGLEVAKAQVGSLKITDSSGREVIVYKESHALVIWAGDYQHWDKLNNIEDEAKEVVVALERQGFEVTVVANPTGQTLKQAMQTFIADYGYKPDNRLVIFFSGHGYTRKKTKGYLVPIDAPDPASNSQSQQAFLKVALDMEQVESWARQMEAKHVLFVFDSCFSGTIFKQRSSSEKPLYIQSVMNKPVRQFLTAGDADQRVPAKSVFTPLFIRALEGEADVIKDGYVTGNELGLYMKQNLSEYTKTQTPQFGTIRDPDLDQGDIVFRALNASQFVATNSPRPTVNPSSVENNSNRSQPSPTPVTSPKLTLISSITGIDYTPLRNLLTAKKWKEADQETERLLLTSAGAIEKGYLDRQDINKFPCNDLDIIDQLWVDYSREQFGISIQKQIWLRIAREVEIQNIDETFAERVGWRMKNGKYLEYHQLVFKENAPVGHLPGWRLLPWWYLVTSSVDEGNPLSWMFARLGTCRSSPLFTAKAFYDSGVGKYHAGDNQGAIADYNQAIKLNPENSDAYVVRGVSKNNLGDYQGAIADYNQVIELKPDAYAYYNRGNSKKALKDYRGAITDFRQAAKLFQQYNNQTYYQRSLDRLKELGVSN